MRSWTIAVVSGVVVALAEPRLADPFWVGFLPLALAASVPARTRPAAGLAVGYLWTLLWAHLALLGTLPDALDGREVVIEGRIEGLIAEDRRRARFVLRVERRIDATGPGWTGRARLAWYGTRPRLRSGERWRLHAKLRVPRGWRNPGGFDFERWRLSRGIEATGYVRRPARAVRLAGPAGGVDPLRERIAADVDRALGRGGTAALLKALAVGDRGGIGEAQWAVLRRTGTGHLMAISGLHVGLVAAAAYLVAGWLWRRVPWACARWPAPRAAVFPALAAAAAYAALAGFAVPTQRALVMLAVGLAAIAVGLRPLRGHALALAALAVVALDPLAPLGAGFWLSFGAVAVILYAGTGRLATGSGSRASRWWWRWGRVHAVLWLGLAPAMGAIFSAHSLVAPLANAVAVPWVGLVVIPLVLGAVAARPWPALADLALAAGAAALEPLWSALAWLAALPWAEVARPAAGAWALAAGVAGAAIVLAPRAVPGRWLGLLWLAPLLVAPAPALAPGAFRVTVLDVGQGLAVVLETRHHALVYDTGPRYGPGHDAARAALLPYLRHRGRVPERAVISHADLDHRGGLASLRAAHPGVSLVGAGGAGARPCVAGRSWAWDGVRFAILHPPRAGAGEGNDESCVLRVEGPGGSALLPGDLERAGESALLARVPGATLASDLLVVGHHGSATSTTPAFAAAVRPRVAVVSRGRSNRFGFPDRGVVRRLRAQGAQVLDTATDGAVQVRFAARAGVAPEIRAARRHARRWWQTGAGPD